MTLRDADGLLESKVRETLEALGLDGTDSAAKELAVRYARIIDECDTDDPKIRAWAMRWIAPLLKDMLDALGATPAARSRMKKGDHPDAAQSPLDQLRAARTAKCR